MVGKWCMQTNGKWWRTAPNQEKMENHEDGTSTASTEHIENTLIFYMLDPKKPFEIPLCILGLKLCQHTIYEAQPHTKLLQNAAFTWTNHLATKCWGVFDGGSITNAGSLQHALPGQVGGRQKTFHFLNSCFFRSTYVAWWISTILGHCLLVLVVSASAVVFPENK